MSRPALLLVLAGVVAGFASNSLLARAALDLERMDPASYTAIRIASGALMLAALVSRTRQAAGSAGSWTSGAALFAYAIAFSLAYVRIPAGVGALILFGAVQVTMVGWGLWTGERPRARDWAGLAMALGGLVALTRPGLTAPDAAGAALMLASGAAWGVYSIRGRGAGDPLAATSGNFARAALPAVLVVLSVVVSERGPRVGGRGVLLAVVSGAVSSGLCYTLWYMALPHLSRVQAAVLQLAVPVVAAAGAVLLLGEAVTARLVVAGAVILGGVALAIRR